MPRIQLTLRKVTRQFVRYEYNGPEGILNVYRPLDKLPAQIPEVITMDVYDTPPVEVSNATA